jgi:hypothetical protein
MKRKAVKTRVNWGEETLISMRQANSSNSSVNNTSILKETTSGSMY